MPAKSAKQILSKIKCENLDLARGEGYWYFVYDNGAKVYETETVLCMRLNDMQLDRWVNAGLAFVEKCKLIEAERAAAVENDKPFFYSLKKGIY